MVKLQVVGDSSRPLPGVLGNWVQPTGIIARRRPRFGRRFFLKNTDIGRSACIHGLHRIEIVGRGTPSSESEIQMVAPFSVHRLIERVQALLHRGETHAVKNTGWPR